MLYLQLGRAREAMAHFEASVRLKPESAATHYNLGTAQTRAGRFEEAIATAQKAIICARLRNENELAARNEQLLELYRAHKPFRD